MLSSQFLIEERVNKESIKSQQRVQEIVDRILGSPPIDLRKRSGYRSFFYGHRRHFMTVYSICTNTIIIIV